MSIENPFSSQAQKKAEQAVEEVEAAKVVTKKQHKVVIVDNAAALEAQARDAAEAVLNVDKAELKGLKGMFQKIWKHNLCFEYYRQKEIAKAKQSIIDSGNLYSQEGANLNAHQEAMGVLVERFASEAEEMLHREAGEDRQVSTNAEINLQISGLLRDYAGGAMDEASFTQARNRIISQTLSSSGLSSDEVASNVRHADNLLQVAHQLRQSVAHGTALEALDFDVEVVIGKAKSGVRTEAQFSKIDKIVAKVRETKVGRMVNETTLTSAVAIAYSVTAGLSRKFASSRLANLATFGGTAILGAGIAGLKESKRMEDDRRQHGRQMAKGEQIGEDDRRRQEMDQFRYQTESARNLISNLLVNLHEIATPTTELLQRTMSQLADIEARIRLSDQNQLDLISYSASHNIERERMNLDVLRAEAKIQLRSEIANNMYPEGLPADQSFDQYLETLVSVRVGDLTDGDGGITSQNKGFKKMKHKQVAKTMGKAFVTGLVIGGAFQEGASLLRDNEQGLVEGFIGGAKNLRHVVSVTPLERLREYIAGEHVLNLSHHLKQVSLPKMGDNIIKIPDNTDLIPSPGDPSHWALVHDGEIIKEHLDFTNGKPDSYTTGVLHQYGFTMHQDISQILQDKDVHSTAEEIIKHHSEMFHDAHRGLWYDNDTPAPVFDKNELGLLWGGSHGTGLNGNGDFVFSMHGMRPDGSYHGQLSTNAQELIKQSKVQLHLSLSGGTQAHVVEVPIDAHGNAVIEKGSWIAKTFFKTVDGKAVFIGRFAEISEMVNDHTSKMLATYEGQDLGLFDDTIQTVKDITTTTLDLPDADPLVMLPPVIPILGRQPLGKTVRENKNVKTIETLQPLTGYYNYYGSDKYKVDKSGFSETIKNNPDANLDYAKEVENYLARQTPEHIALIRGLALDLDVMEDGCRLAICMPVASHQEGENIYATLENYLNQTADPKSFEINILANRPAQDPSGKDILPDKTVSEIERFKKDHPELQVNFSDITIHDKEKVTMGYIRKLLNDITLFRSHERYNEVSDLILVSNEADNKGMVPQYVENYIQKFDQHPDTDSLAGQLDWDTKAFVKNPLLHIGTRLFQYVDVQLISKNQKMNSTGANSAVRSSIYAAVGGYSPTVNLGEDLDLGSKIAGARQGATHKMPIAFAGSGESRLYTSTRRAEKSLADGFTPVEQWDRGFSAFDDEVRKIKWENIGDKIDFTNPDQVTKLVDNLQGVINRSLKAMGQWSYGDSSLFKRALGWLGLQYKMNVDGSIKILNADKLVAGLTKYQDEGLEILKNKLSKVKNIS